jgi:hypothetical protein
MPNETVHIDELYLRVPGLSMDEARRLSEEVTRRVADALPGHGRAGHLGALDLRVTIPHGTPRDRLALVVAEKILLGLQ